MNRASIYIRSKGTEATGKLILTQLVDMTVGTGIHEVEGDLLVEFRGNAEGDYLKNILEAVKSGKSNIIIVDKLESFFNNTDEARKFALQLMNLGACIFVRKNDDLVLYQDKENYCCVIQELASKWY